MAENKERFILSKSMFDAASGVGIAASRAVGYLVRLLRKRRKLSYCE
jgi:hypothetical protein